ncbi:MAG: DUF2892 domain-containing protein [Bacteroidia bacterium]|nr:DUF2892 domain-containing protein [Bacteroidia bacterium]
MKKNMGTTDRLIRFMLALLFISLFFADIITGTLGIILMAISLIFVGTSFIGFCPLYAPFKLNTIKRK